MPTDPDASAAPLAPTLGKSAAKCRVMIVDDEQVVREILARALRGVGINTVYLAIDGADAWDAAASFDPDLIILDLNMPNMNGVEFLKKLRADPVMGKVPVLVQTGVESSDDKLAAFQAGATDLINKPVSRNELIARVGVHLENRVLMHDLEVFRDRLTEELAGAVQVQADILPSHITLATLAAERGLTVTAAYRPSSEVGGDLWTAFPLADGAVGVIVVDMSGHGVAAAMNGARFHALISPPPAEAAAADTLMTYLNRRLNTLMPLGQFAAGVYMTVDPEAGRLSWAGAAFQDPILVPGRGQAAARLNASGLPLGVLGSSTYEAETAEIGPGGVVFLYSDALVETEDANGIALSPDEVAAEVEAAARAGTDPVARLEGLYRARFGDHLPDDLTMVACRWA